VRYGLIPATTSHPSPTRGVTGITAYLENGGTIENAQAIAAHESPRTTKLYDRTGDEITLDEVERIATQNFSLPLSLIDGRPRCERPLSYTIGLASWGTLARNGNFSFLCPFYDGVFTGSVILCMNSLAGSSRVPAPGGKGAILAHLIRAKLQFG
jgi:hypothetical protein